MPPRPASRLIIGQTLAVMALVLLCMSWRLGDAPLAGTEGHRAVTAHEMVQTGRWLIPRIYGEPYLAKPPLHYWTLALSETLFGSTSEWVYRLPSVLAAALLAAALCLTAHRWFGPPAGVVSGIAFLALITLWSQSSSTDIDSINTLLSVSAALGLLAIGLGTVKQRWVWSIATSLALGGALLAKGPAGVPLMLAATLAPLIATRSWRPLKNASLWLAWVMGLCIAGAWALAVWLQLRGNSPALDLSGVNEVARTVTNTGMEVMRSLLVPLEVLVYSIPVSFALPVAMARLTTRSLGESQRRAASALAWTVILALMIGVIARITNPRYALIVLPMLCPLAGGIAAEWARGWYDEPAQRRLRQLMTICTIGLAVVAVVLTALVNYDRESLDTATIVAGAAAVFIGVWSVRQWMRVRIAAACAGLVGVLITCSFIFGTMRNESRAQISSRDAGFALRDLIGEGQTVTSGMWVMNGPELFHYAGANVEYYRDFLRKPRDFPSDRWIVFHSDEWQNWSDHATEHRLSSITVLPTRKRNAILAWYDAPDG